MIRMNAAPWGILLLLSACSSGEEEVPTETTDGTTQPPSDTADTATIADTGDSSVPSTGTDTDATGSCSGWEALTEMHGLELADLEACSDPTALWIESTLMNMDGLVITGASVVGDDGGTSAEPCVEVACDADHIYIASNALPHYDPQAQPIFSTTPTPVVHKVPLYPTSNVESATADDWRSPQGCDVALSNWVGAVVPEVPPSNHCWYQTEDGSYNTGSTMITDGEETVHKVHCYGQTGTVITGVPTFAPCEEAQPDPYGSPLFATWADPVSLFVDLCGTHPAAITHNHWLVEACLALDEDNKPENSYAVGASTFDVEAMDDVVCAEPSAVLGWSYDGHPISGTCVCMERDDEGDCIDVRRARSGYVYAGLARWADDAHSDANVHTDSVTASGLAHELETCSETADCCPDGGRCELYCHPLLVEEEGDVVMEGRCVTPDYSWCSHAFVEHESEVESDGYVYADRCNGLETADGYQYVGTPTFPYVNSCYRDAPTSSALDETYIRLDAGDAPGPGGPGGPGMP